MFKRWLPVVCFNAEGGSAGGSNEGSGENNGSSEQPKTFTQEEVTALLAKEKQQGKNSVLRALGLKSVEEAKTALESAKNKSNADKTAEEQAAEALNLEKTARTTAEANLLAANRKIAVMQAGFNPQFVDDVVAVASGKVTEDKDFDAVIEEMKKTHQFYLAVAPKEEDKKGTGGSAAGYKKDQGKSGESYGAQLAKKQVASRKAIDSVKFFS